jgi:2-amino-4-hydroxy-6-hydroxymethyldihydropteridine diphosphokinase
MVEVYIGLGSNLGDREDNLRRALEHLRQRMKLAKVSFVYESEPLYVADQPWFLNCVAKFETNLSPGELLAYVQHIENDMGRERRVRYGPRNIDLDILFYGNRILNIDDILRIPHPLIQERRFVLLPLREIAPDFVHPVRGLTVETLLANLNSNEVVRKKGTID